jgi:hypothetical protein
MKNPCEICVIKTNCTDVCFEKLNYKTLIKNAIIANQNSHGFENHCYYMALLRQTNRDEEFIRLRKSKKEGEF